MVPWTIALVCLICGLAAGGAVGFTLATVGLITKLIDAGQSALLIKLGILKH